MYQFCYVQAVNRLGQYVVIAVAFAAHRRLDARFGQSFAVANGHILRTPVAVVNQGIGTSGLAGIKGLLQCIQHIVSLNGTALASARNSASVDVNHKGRILPALPGRDTGKVRHPKLIGTINLELPVDPIQWGGVLQPAFFLAKEADQGP